jgi:diguanylate cyclase (GGDEF)-like protein
MTIFSERGNLIVPPFNENNLLLSIKSSKIGREEFENFIKINIEKVAVRNDILIEKGPAGEHHFFIPIHFNNPNFIVVGGGVYLSLNDFNEFCRNGYKKYGLRSEEVNSLNKEEMVCGCEKFLSVARHIQSIFHTVIKSFWINSINEKRYKVLKTFLNIVSDIKPEEDLSVIYDILCDVIVFFYNIDGLVLFSKKDEEFVSKKVIGRDKRRFESLLLYPKGLLLNLVEKKKPILIDSLIDILQLGLPDYITTVHIFPILVQDDIKELICIFNAEFHQDEVEIVFELCRAAGYIFSFSKLKEKHDLCLSEKEIITKVVERLIPLKELDRLYEMIVDTSTELVNAEKASLMVSENGSSHLSIKAARGMSRRLFSEVKIVSGEGIAGQVYQRGEPIVVRSEEDERMYPLSKRTKYKTSSFVSLPLKVGEDIFGVLNIADKVDGTSFSENDVILLNAFSIFASLAIERANYYSLAGQLKELSITDSLTGLFNRRYFEERLVEEMNRSLRHELKFSLAMMDIDDFKQFNDAEGHLMGDEILKYIANVSRECLRVSDVISRFGGEEFAIIMPQTEKDEAFLVAERIRKSIKEQIPQIWKKFPRKNITITIGVSTFPEDGDNRRDLIRNADRALYRGKIEGKDRTIVFGKE